MLTFSSRQRSGGSASRQYRLAPFFLLLAIIPFAAACRRAAPVRTLALDNSGISYDAVQQLKELKISSSEVDEIVKVHDAGLSDEDCVQLVRIFHGRGSEFKASNTVTDLLRAGIGRDVILELSKLNQLGLGAGELQAIHLAGLSDAILLEVARHHAQGTPVLSGASLATLKNAGFRESTLLEFTRRGVTDSQLATILSLRRHRLSDAEILRRLSAS
jgi:hypothetical protein